MDVRGSVVLPILEAIMRAIRRHNSPLRTIAVRRLCPYVHPAFPRLEVECQFRPFSQGISRGVESRRSGPRRSRLNLTATALTPSPPESSLPGATSSSLSPSRPPYSDGYGPSRPRQCSSDQKKPRSSTPLEALVEIQRIVSSLVGELALNQQSDDEALADEDTESDTDGEDGGRFTGDDGNDDYVEASGGMKTRRRPWDEDAEDLLRRLKKVDGLSDIKIAKQLDRTQSAIEQHWRIMCKEGRKTREEEKTWREEKVDHVS